MIQKKELNRIYWFITLSFGISWATALVIYLTGGLEDSPFLIIANVPVSLALFLMATFYMFGPAVANIITRVITKEGKQNLHLKPNFRQGRWLYFLAAWLLPGLFTIIGMGVFFVLFPGNYDSNLSLLTAEMKAAGAENFSPWFVVGVQALQATLIAPVLNALPSFGEEFGWRGYLLPKLLPLGGRKASLLTGVTWGVWHWPLILMGYNYGSGYFGAPFLGPLAMVWFCVVTGVVFGWMSIKGGSIWPAVIGHGALNGIAALSLLFVQGEPNTLLGPTPVGLIGGAGFTILAVILFLVPNAFEH
ncbi:MAG: CPBP family intramembrane glutamic endopeptidase [Anaerolineaceae bacterium]